MLWASHKSAWWQMVSPQVPLRAQLLWGPSYSERSVWNTLCWVTHHCSPFLQGFTSYLAREQSCSSFQHQHLFFARPEVSAQNKHEFQPSQVQSSPSHVHCSGSLKLYRKVATTLQSTSSAHHNLSSLQKKCSKQQMYMLEKAAKYKHLVTLLLL